MHLTDLFIPCIYVSDMEKFKRDLLQRLKNSQLYPFYGSVVLYFVLYQPFWDYPPVTFFAAVCKVLPILSLAFFVRQTSDVASSEIFPTLDYNKFIMVGLLISSIGDAFLVARSSLFVPGMLAFSVAHCSYLYAMENGSSTGGTKTLFSLGAIASFLFIADGIDSYILKFLVLIYTGLLFSVGWKAMCRYEHLKSFSSQLASIGLLLFMFSDFIIATDRWKVHVPFTELITMTTYYMAQLFIAISTENTGKTQ